MTLTLLKPDRVMDWPIASKSSQVKGQFTITDTATAYVYMCRCLYVSMSMCAHIGISMSVSLCIDVYVSMSTCAYVYVCLCLCVPILVWLCLCVPILVCLCLCVSMSTCAYVYVDSVSLSILSSSPVCCYGDQTAS